jgi:hypothetical protein
MTVQDNIVDILTSTSMSSSKAEVVAAAILAALPDAIPDLVWVTYSSEDQPFLSAKGYNIQSMPHSTWEWNGCFSTDINVVKAAANAHHRAAFNATLTGKQHN